MLCLFVYIKASHKIKESGAVMWGLDMNQSLFSKGLKGSVMQVTCKYMEHKLKTIGLSIN